MQELLILIGGGIVTVIVFWFGGKQAGRQAERTDRERQRGEAIKDKKEIDDEVDALAPADLDVRFDHWMRNKGR